jgi:acyl-CoA thioester hydrolase
VGRVEALRKMDFSYKALEDSGIFLPVLDYSVRFSKPALYDDLLTIETSIPEIPATRIKFIYRTRNEQGTQLNEAQTTLVFVNRKTNKPCAAPQEFLSKIRPYFI